MRWGLKKYCSSDSSTADYILSLKSNHPTLFQQVEQWFQQMQADGSHPQHTTESGHHRIDTRTVWTLSVDSFAASIKQTRGQDCKVSSWNGLVGYGTKPPTKCSSTQQFAAA